jgi:hypothetical protein
VESVSEEKVDLKDSFQFLDESKLVAEMLSYYRRIAANEYAISPYSFEDLSIHSLSEGLRSDDTGRMDSDSSELPPAFRNRKWKSSKDIMDYAGCISENTARKMKRFLRDTDKAYESS